MREHVEAREVGQHHKRRIDALVDELEDHLGTERFDLYGLKRITVQFERLLAELGGGEMPDAETEVVLLRRTIGNAPGSKLHDE